MSQSGSRTTSFLSVVVTILTAGAALAGLVFRDLYQDPAAAEGFSKAYWLGNDIVILAVAVPLLAAAHILARRGSLRARLVWLGLAYFVTYNYSFQLFGGSLNWFYPLHAALVVLPVFVLISGLADIDLLRFVHAGADCGLFHGGERGGGRSLERAAGVDRRSCRLSRLLLDSSPRVATGENRSPSGEAGRPSGLVSRQLTLGHPGRRGTDCQVRARRPTCLAIFLRIFS
jgi:hypothetical protein